MKKETLTFSSRRSVNRDINKMKQMITSIHNQHDFIAESDKNTAKINEVYEPQIEPNAEEDTEQPVSQIDIIVDNEKLVKLHNLQNVNLEEEKAKLESEYQEKLQALEQAHISNQQSIEEKLRQEYDERQRILEAKMQAMVDAEQNAIKQKHETELLLKLEQQKEIDAKLAEENAKKAEQQKQQEMQQAVYAYYQSKRK